MKKTKTNWDLEKRSLGTGSCWRTDRTWENKSAKGKSMTSRTHRIPATEMKNENPAVAKSKQRLVVTKARE
jgi:hypothetical protein